MGPSPNDGKFSRVAPLLRRNVVGKKKIKNVKPSRDGGNNNDNDFQNNVDNSGKTSPDKKKRKK